MVVDEEEQEEKEEVEVEQVVEEGEKAEVKEVLEEFHESIQNILHHLLLNLSHLMSRTQHPNLLCTSNLSQSYEYDYYLMILQQ